MVRKKLYKFIAMILTGSVLLTQPGIIQMAGTVPVYAEEAAEQDAAASISDSGAEGTTDSSGDEASEENTGDATSGGSASETTSGDTSSTSSEEGEESTDPAAAATETEASEQEKKTEDSTTVLPAANSVSDEEYIKENSQILGDPTGKYADIVSKFLAALNAIAQEKTDISAIQAMFNRINAAGVASGGIIAILQMTGILSDPTADSLKNITEILEAQNQMLLDLSNKMSGISAKLDTNEANAITRDRARVASDACTQYNNYCSKYLDQLRKEKDIYVGKVRNGFSDWVNTAYEQSESLAAYYTIIDNNKEQAYSNADYFKTYVSSADNGEKIHSRFTVELPAEYVYNALLGYEFDANTYKEEIIARLKTAVIEAADNGELLIGEGSCFYEDWVTATIEGTKEKKAEEIAIALFNNLAYTISCDAIKGNNKFVLEVKNDYIDMCNNLLKNNSGMNAVFMELTNIYSFEAEVREELLQAINDFYLIVGNYGLFVQSLLSQDKLVTLEERNAIIDLWYNTNKNLEKFKETNITNQDNYCYITNSVLTYQTLTISSETIIKTQEWKNGLGMKYVGYDSTDAKPIKLTVDGKEVNNLTAVSGVSLKVISDIWNKTADKKTIGQFSDYLSKYVKNTPSLFSDSLLTGYSEPKTFELLKEYPMLTKRGTTQDWGKMNYFSDGKITKVGEKNPGYRWRVHDNVLGDTFELSSCSIKNEQNIFARAVYGQTEKKWFIDEAWYFSTGNTTHTFTRRDNRYTTNVFNSDTTVGFIQSEERTKGSVETGDDITLLNPIDVLAEKAIDPSIFNPDNDTACPVLPLKTLEDWTSSGFETILKTSDDEKLSEFITEYVNAKATEGVDGSAVKISDASMESISSAISQKLSKAETEFDQNENLQYSIYYDPFGIYGNTDAMTKLAEMILPDVYKTDDGKVSILTDNMITAATLEPLVSLKFARTDGKLKAKLSNLVEVQPLLLIWDAESDSYMQFEITDEVMKELGLSMKVRLSAASLGDAKQATVTHYDDFFEMNEIEKKTTEVQGSGDSSYVEISVSSCSPFAVASASAQGEDADDDDNSGNGNNGNNGNNGSKGNGSSSGSSAKGGTASGGSSAKGTSNVKTGDTTNVIPYIILLLAAAACLGGIIIYRRKKQ